MKFRWLTVVYLGCQFIILISSSMIKRQINSNLVFENLVVVLLVLLVKSFGL
jgi:hypothetical protein